MPNVPDYIELSEYLRVFGKIKHFPAIWNVRLVFVLRNMVFTPFFFFNFRP